MVPYHCLYVLFCPRINNCGRVVGTAQVCDKIQALLNLCMKLTPTGI